MNDRASRGYESRSQQTLLKVQEALALNPLEGRTVQNITDSVDGASRDQVFRALKNLEIAGHAEQGPTGWRPTRHASYLSEMVRRAIADLHTTYLGGSHD